MEEITKDNKIFLNLDVEKEDYLLICFDKIKKELIVKMGTKCVCKNCYIDMLGKLEYVKMNLQSIFSMVNEESNIKKQLSDMIIKKKDKKE